MFGWFREKKQPRHEENGVTSDLAAQIQTTCDLCIAAFTKTWRDLDHPPASTPEQLSAEIEKFSVNAFHAMFTNFPLTKHLPPDNLWLMVFTSVLKARTHPNELVNKAIALLETKYAS